MCKMLKTEYRNDLIRLYNTKERTMSMYKKEQVIQRWKRYLNCPPHDNKKVEFAVFAYRHINTSNGYLIPKSK